MRKGGVGGANTLTGLEFETKTDFVTFLNSLDGYELKKNKNMRGKSAFYNIFYEKKFVGHIFQQYGLYYFFEQENINWEDYWSKKLYPDDAIFVLTDNKVYIIEKKYQETEGSVDEKLQTADFKYKQYKRIFSLLNIDVEYVYLLNDWFTKDKYKDTRDYINSVGCSFYIN